MVLTIAITISMYFRCKVRLATNSKYKYYDGGYFNQKRLFGT